MHRSTRTEQEQIAFFEQCFDRFQAARDATESICLDYCVAGWHLRLSFAGSQLVPLITPALAHLRVPHTQTPDLTLCLWDSESTEIPMVQPPCDRNCFTDRGDIWGFDSQRIKTAFHWIENSVNVLDREKRIGIFWVQTKKALPFWVYASPLRTLLHWWMEEKNCQLLHAAAVGTENGAILITGKGASGKSTTALTCLQAGFFYVADDYLIVRSDPHPTVYSLYCTAKLNFDNLAGFEGYRTLIRNPQNMEAEKAVIFLHPHLSQSIRPSMPIKAVFAPQITDQETSYIAPIPYWTIQRAMAFTTMSQLPGVGRHTHEFINRFCANLPFYQLFLGRRRDLIPKTITDFLISPPQKENRPSPAIISPPANPLISVIIPVYNGERFIEKAIANICSQKYPAMEIIVVDDGSTDATARLVNHFDLDIRYFRQDNQGPASARNRGLKDASGEFVLFLDVDDYWPENNIQRLVAHISEDESLGVVRGYAQVVEDNLGEKQTTFCGNPRESFADYIGAAIYRKHVFNTVGLFDPGLLFGEDTDWYVRARECHIKIKRIEEVTLYVRRHGGNMTEGKSLVELNTLHVFKKALDRRRAAQKMELDGK
jgi:hypothetical protein